MEGGGGWGMERQTGRQTDRPDRQTNRQIETENSNSKTLFYKGYSLGSVKTYFATSPC